MLARTVSVSERQISAVGRSFDVCDVRRVVDFPHRRGCEPVAPFTAPFTAPPVAADVGHCFNEYNNVDLPQHMGNSYHSHADTASGTLDGSSFHCISSMTQAEIFDDVPYPQLTDSCNIACDGRSEVSERTAVSTTVGGMVTSDSFEGGSPGSSFGRAAAYGPPSFGPRGTGAGAGAPAPVSAALRQCFKASFHQPEAALVTPPPPSPPATGDELSDGMLSLGSAFHSIGQCTPCKFYRGKRGCRYGAQCTLCHFEHSELTYSAVRRSMRRRGLDKKHLMQDIQAAMNRPHATTTTACVGPVMSV